MPATDARPVPRRNAAYRLTLPLYDATGALVSGAADLDSEVSLDGGAFADCTNEATEIGASGVYYLDLTAAELDADTVVVRVQTSTADARTAVVILYPEEAGDIRVNVTAISDDATAADNLEAAADGTGYNLGAGQVVAASVTAAVTAGTVSDKAGYSLSAGGVTAVQSGLSTLTAAEVNAEVDAALADYDPPTAAELTARTLAAADYATAAALAAAQASVDAVDDLVDDLEARLTAGRAAALDNLDAAVSSRLAGAAYTAPPAAATVAGAVLDEALSGHAAAGSAGEALGRLDAAISTRATPAQVQTEAADALADVGLSTVITARLDATVSSRLAASAYTAPDNAGIADVQGRLPAALVAGRIDAHVGALGDDTLTAAALAADAVTGLQAGLATDADLDLARADLATLLARLTADRAGNLDHLDAAVSSRQPTGAVALTTDERAALVAAVLAATTEPGLTVAGFFRAAAAALFGKGSGLGTTTATYRDVADSRDRITATVDEDGNRLTISLDLS